MLAEHIRRFRGLRAVVIGDAMLDTYIEGTARRICAEGPVPVIEKTAETRLPGGAANTAANIRAMGAQVAFLAVTGDDSAGLALRKAARDLDVGDTEIIADTQAATIHKLRILSGGQYVVRLDEGSAERWSPDVRVRLASRLQALIERCDLIVASDYGYGTITDEMLQILGERPQRVPLFVDSKNVRRFRGCRSSLITPNHLEAFVAVHGRLPGPDEREAGRSVELSRRLLDLVGCDCAAITMAAGGIAVSESGGEDFHVQARSVAAPSEVGAGDTFVAATALALTSGASTKEAVLIGRDAAYLAVSREGTAVVSQQELLRASAKRSRLVSAPMESVLAELRTEQALGHCVVFTNGVFDILHAGHVEFLREAKRLGDVLVVAVNSDKSAGLLKGHHHPINEEADRVALVEALDPVDYAFLFDESEPSELIRAIRPAIHVKGGDFGGEELPEAEAVSDTGGRIEFVPLNGEETTSQVVERILRLEKDAVA